MIEELDKEMVYELIYFDLLIEVLERDLIAIDASNLKFKAPYKEKVTKLINSIFQERKELKAKMRTRGIKMFERNVLDKEFIDWSYICRGFEGVQRIWTAAIRKRIQELLRDRL